MEHRTKQIKEIEVIPAWKKDRNGWENCQNCHASYERYETGTQEGMGGGWCEVPIGVLVRGQIEMKPPKGLCGFCNNKSHLFNEWCKEKEKNDSYKEDRENHYSVGFTDKKD